jgi:hypothetical protein
MEAIFQWLLSYGPWGLIIAMLFYDRYRFSTGQTVSARSVDWVMQGHRDLASAVERMADSLDKNTDALIGAQTALRNLEEGQRHMLERQQRSPGGGS